MTTTLIPLGGGSSSRETVIAEDILAAEGGVIRKRGPLALRQNVDNGFPLMRQHVGSTGEHRPAPNIGDYPQGLWLGGTGAESDGYGAKDSGSGTYLNLGRDREGVWQTQSWWICVKARTANDVGTISLYNDTEGWGSLLRSYYRLSINPTTGAITIWGDAPGDGSGSQPAVNVGTVAPFAWNDNKYDRHYLSLTTWLGHSDGPQAQFGAYGAFQFNGKVFDLRGLGGTANYPPSPIAQPGSSFSGGNNPGLGITSPTAGRNNGVVIYDFALTIGDTL